METEDIQPEFPGQREGEEVVFILFKHWFIVAKSILKAGSIILLSLFLPIWLAFTHVIFSYPITALIYYLWHVFWVLYMVHAYITWFKDRFIITSERIIDIDQKGMWVRRVSTIELSKIQNLTHEIRGFWATLFNFGSVTVQSPAGDITLDSVGDPAGVQEDITLLVKEADKGSSLSSEELIQLIRQSRT